MRVKKDFGVIVHKYPKYLLSKKELVAPTNYFSGYLCAILMDTFFEKNRLYGPCRPEVLCRNFWTLLHQPYENISLTLDTL